MEDERTVRVLPGPTAGKLRLLDRETFDPVVVTTDGSAQSTPLQPGYLVDARLEWSAPEPVIDAVDIRRRTLYTFADGIEPVFEVARDVWEDARASGDGMNSRVTRNTDNEVNGVCYVFADGQFDDIFAEFRDGTRPIEPLVDRVNEQGEPAARDVFVLRPAEEAFVIVTIALEKHGQFARTLRETYDLERPGEPRR